MGCQWPKVQKSAVPSITSASLRGQRPGSRYPHSQEEVQNLLLPLPFVPDQWLVRHIALLP